jgi:glycosyltransferase involved in cell wall biosynthesis
VNTVRLDPGLAVSEFRSALRNVGDAIVVVAGPEVNDAGIELLAAALAAPGVASASPVPASTERAVRYRLHPLLPPAASLALPCRSCCAFRGDTLAGLSELRPDAASVAELLVGIAERQLQRGWRHVIAPGLAMDWPCADATGIEPTAAWQTSVVADLVGPANVGLEAHMSWAAAQVGSLRVVVDGACVTDDPHTGTQHLVVQVARELANTRPEAHVVLAVPEASIPAARAAVAGTAVQVADRNLTSDGDVLYRPYQMLFASEMRFVTDVGRRCVVGQLDMIGFSNPFYHPSNGLFALARNLQRHLMRASDGVTFISEYGRESAFAECPDLDRNRLHVVSCGADPTPEPGTRPAAAPSDLGSFLLCLSATFWHKNRAHAISTFADLAEHGYAGSLVIVGPEPFYGRSIEADDDLLGHLDAAIARRVHFLGQATENDKWWLLQHADAVIYPSVLEGFGLVPFEAAAVGTPCLAYSGTAPGELLASTQATITSWDPAAWADRIRTWLSDPAARDLVIGEVGDVAREHTWRRCAERTWDAIDAALAQPRRSHPPEEGGVVSRVSAWGSGRAPAPRARFTAARAAPALRRRVASTTARLKKRTP